MEEDDLDLLLNSDLFDAPSSASGKGKGKGKAKGDGGGKPANANAPFNPAAIFAPTVKKEGGGGANKAAAARAKPSVDLGLDSLDALWKAAEQKEKAVAAVARNAYQGLVERGITTSTSASQAGTGTEEEGEEDEDEEVGNLEALQALVKGSLNKGEGEGKKKKKKRRQIYDDDEEEEGQGAMEREEMGDWMGLASVFRMEDSAAFPSLTLPASLPEAQGWGTEYRKLRQALVDAEAKGLLPDLLNLMGPGRWLEATDSVAPPGLVDWLWKALAWHVDPAVSQGAFRTLKMLLRGEDGVGPFPKGLQGWTLPFAHLQMLFRPYGVRLLHQPATYATFLGHNPSTNAASNKSTPQPFLDTYGLPALGAADLSETAAQRRAKAKSAAKSGIPPTTNLRGLLAALAWCLRGGRVQLQGEEAAALLYALLVLGIDRYVQADCPDEVRAAVAGLLHAIPESSWPTALTAVLDAIIPAPSADGATANAPSPQQAAVRLGVASVLHIARAALPSLKPGRAGDRAREFLAAVLRRVIEGRVLLPLASKQQGPSPALAALQALPSQTQQDRQSYLLSLLDLLLGEAAASCPEAMAALAPAGLNVQERGDVEGAEGTGLDRVLFLAYALGLWAQLSLLGQGGGAGARGRAYAVELHGKLTRLEKGKLRNQTEEAVQSAKDVLSQAALSAQALVPKGPTQAKLTSMFARKPAADGDAMDVDDD